MNTYIFAYYVEKTNEKDIFEDNQHDLEAATEKLSGYLEREIGDEELNKIKLKVISVIIRLIVMLVWCVERREEMSFNFLIFFFGLALKVQDMVSYCAGRRQVLITHVREGHEKESWNFNQTWKKTVIMKSSNI